MDGPDYLEECEAYVLREIPPRLRQALGRELDSDLNIVEERLRRKATECVKALIAEVFKELRHAASPPAFAQGLPSSLPHAEESLGQDTQESRIPEQETILSDFNVNFLDAFTMLGDEELGFDQGGLMENLLQQQEPDNSKKLSDSGYESSSAKLSRRELPGVHEPGILKYLQEAPD